jgi:hypothetical protein
MKKILIICFVVLSTTVLYSQSNYYYYYKGEKKYLTVDKKHVNIIVDNSFSKQTIQNISLKDFDLKDTGFENQKMSEVEFQTDPTDIEYLQKTNALKNNPNVIGVAKYFKRGDNIPAIGTSNIFYVKLKNSTDFSLLQNFANQKNVTIVREVPLYAKLVCIIS